MLDAQAVPTARRAADLSFFAGPTLLFTGLNQGRNGAISAGADLDLPRHFGLDPSLEIRGSFPVADGQVDSQRAILGGIRFGHAFGRIHPFADILFGRVAIEYNPYLPDPAHVFLYARSTSNLLSPGAGIRIDLSTHFGLMADAQFQRYATPVSVSGHLFAVPITAAVVYRFNLERVAPARRR